MIYEIVNPSDMCTLEAEDRAVAAIAVLLLGEGKYALTAETEKEEDGVPLFFFGGAVEWFEATFASGIQPFLQARSEEIADCLDGVLLCGIDERRTLFEPMSAHEKLAFLADREAWHDARRSSLNDIARRAWRIAARLRERAAKQREEEA